MKSGATVWPAISPRAPLLPVLAVFVVLALAALLSAHQLGTHLPPALWWQALIAPDSADVRELLVHDSDLPRIVLTWICGAALALSGVAIQQVLRNPLAEPMTLGIFPGAYLALSIATVFAPAWLRVGRDAIALTGATAALAVVFALSWRRGMAPLALILAGMIVNLYCGALSLALVISHGTQLDMLMIWAGGAFRQSDWHTPFALLIRLVPCAAVLLLCLRPMTVLGVGDDIASALGVSLRATRALALFLTLLVTAFVASAVGMVGFVGLAAPTLVRLAGARRPRDQMLWAPLFGAALLWLADQLAQLFSGVHGTMIPTGAITGLLGAPLLLALLPRLRGRLETARASPGTAALSGRGCHRTVGVCAAFLLATTALSLSLGRDLHGWHWSGLREVDALLFLRLPHVVAAMSVGVLLALAGVVVQRITGNPMASPDLLGITAGGALGVTGAIFLTTHPGMPTLLIWCAAGTLITTGVLIVLGRRSSFAPDTLVLTGVTISAVLQAVSTVLMASGDPRLMMLLSLLTGSTYNVSATSASIVAATALVALASVPLCRRWLAMLPLGASVARALGVNVAIARFSLLIFSALVTAAATLVIGPLSFVGLMAPHMIRLLGIQRVVPVLFASAAAGATLMVFSDWLGRWIFFPQEMPAGIVASVIGGLYLIVTMLMRGA